MHKCYVCGRLCNLHKHHIIHRHGKKKVFETRESLIDICFDCHRLVHRSFDTNLDFMLKQSLQARYFEKGYDEEKVRKLMGGKLLSGKTDADFPAAFNY
jgi:5-methylcytosine-specific restriction endonuclease McrA